MPKNVVQDIMVSKKISANRQVPLESVPRKPIPPRRRSSLNLRGMFSKKWLFVLAVVAVGIFIILSFTKGVVLEITPRSEVFSIDEIVPTDTSVEDGVPFEFIDVEGSMEQEVPSRGLKDVERKASGKIVVFNIYSTSPQRLIARTRFETPEGLVYRVADAITVPGKTTKDGKTIPGSIEIMVFADEPGNEYNISFSEFSVPGLKGTPVFDGVYARSKTPMTGGFSGLTKEVAKEDEDRARGELENALLDSLKQKAIRDLTENQILFNDAIFIEFTEARKEDIEKENEPVLLVVSAKLRGFVFNRTVLSDRIAREVISGERATGVVIDNLDVLNFKILNKGSVNTDLPQNVSIAIDGDGIFVWPVDEEKIKEALLGLPKDEATYKRMFSDSFPNVVEARVTRFAPFWAQEFPMDPEKIEIKKVVK